METTKHTDLKVLDMNTTTDNMTARDILKQAWIKSGAYRTESLAAYINRVMSVNA